MVTRASISGLGLILLLGCSGTSIEEPAPTPGAPPGEQPPTGAAPTATSGTGTAPAEPAPSNTAAPEPTTPDPTLPGPAVPEPTAPDPTTPDPTLPNPTTPEPTPSAPSPGASYPGHGFVVHEWGTNTVVSASNGALELGLHHEEEDLPAFVYDRIKAAATPEDLVGAPHFDAKMETPVLYFYAESPLTVHAKVNFPSGILTQWYPGVAEYMPPMSWVGVDPDEDPAFSSTAMTDRCSEIFLKNGSLDWGAFELTAERPAPETLPSAPLEDFSWSYARDVASRAVRFPDGETEQFLFYRGLSHLEMPAVTRALGAGHLSIENTTANPLGSVFVVDVRSDSGAFELYSEGVAASSTLELSVPADSSQQPLDAFTTALGAAVTQALDATGLYHDEAVAMVNTWAHQWFKTPGLRIFYLAPEAWTDSVLPLTLDPIPESVVRVMMVRAELLTPEVEAADAVAAGDFAADDAGARAYFAALGRFAEPRLRRALETAPSTGGSAFLAEIAPGYQRSASFGE